VAKYSPGATREEPPVESYEEDARRSEGAGKGNGAAENTPGNGAKSKGPEFISAPNLWRMRHEPTRWAVRQILPEGVTLFCGKPKTGKSWLAIHLGISIGAGGLAFGAIEVEAGPVLYLALEDTKRRLTKRLRILCGAIPPAEQFDFMTDCPRLGSGGEEVLRAWLREHPTARLIVIDTLARFRPHANAKQTPYANDYVVGEYLSRLCVEFQVSVLVLGHLRKQPGDDPIDEISGTLGLVGGRRRLHGAAPTSNVG
jgi:RecA-family ATPase